MEILTQYYYNTAHLFLLSSLINSFHPTFSFGTFHKNRFWSRNGENIQPRQSCFSSWSWSICQIWLHPLIFFSSSVLHSLFSWSASQSQTVKRLNRTNSKCTSLCLVFLPGLSGTVCRPAQPANPSRAVQLPASQILHRSPVSLHPHGGALLTGLIHTDPRSATVVTVSNVDTVSTFQWNIM